MNVELFGRRLSSEIEDVSESVTGWTYIPGRVVLSRFNL